MTPGESAKRRRSSALVVTLLGVVLLTIIVVAFMQTMSLALATSKSYADIRRATLAAQAGVDTAIAQITVAVGTNVTTGSNGLAFVTGLTNYPTNNFPTGSGLTNWPVTVIGQGNLTNLDQMMPLVSGPIAYLTNFGVAGFSNNFNTYVTNRANYNAAQTVNLNVTSTATNTPFNWIEKTSDTNKYLASWVYMTNIYGPSTTPQTNYTRFAYVVLDNAARINPMQMTGTGTGYTNSTNWYTGPQDINAAYLTNSAGFQAINPTQMAPLTNSTSSNSFGYSDGTLGMAFGTNGVNSPTDTNKIFLTTRANPSFDIIPAWMPNGGMPKYNINDLATNTVYGTAMDRATNIASIITNNLPNFYQRDPALTAAPDTTHFLYVSRLAANIVDYISPDNGTPDPTNNFLNTDYANATNQTGGKYPGISPQGHGVYPVLINEASWVPITPAGAGDGTGTKYTTATYINQFWLSCWNPYTTPVTISSASLHITFRPGYNLGGGPTAYPGINGGTNADYASSVYVIRGANGTVTNSLPYVVQPNEFVTMGFVPQTNTITGNSTSSGPASITVDGPIANLEQYALNINGQTVAQSGAQNATAPQNAAKSSGGLQHESETLSTNYDWERDGITVWGSEVADPRMESYYNDVWENTHDTNTAYTGTSSYWNGVDLVSGGVEFGYYVFPKPVGGSFPAGSTWAERDNIARSPANGGSEPSNGNLTPDTLPDEYNTNDASAAPDVIRNGAMVSIGELGHIFDPANANNLLTAVAPRSDTPGFTNAYSNGGARSLRIGAPEYTGTGTNYISAPAPVGWNVNGERAINLLDLFTVNNANTNTTGTNSIAQSMNYGGAVGRVNINTASSNVLAAVFYGIQLTSDTGMTNSSGTVISPALTNIQNMASNVIANRPYSCLSDLYKIMPLFDTNVAYSPNLTMTTAISGYNWGGNATTLDPYPSVLNVFNRVHQEAFGKLVQHLTVQSRSYTIYAVGQVLDGSQYPHASVAIQVGIYLQYNATEGRYNPVIQYVNVLN